jgi:protein gp37
VTSIEWTRGDDGTPGMTWNPVRGCTRVSEGCRHCYAETFAARNLPEMRSPTTGEPFALMTPGGPRWTGRVELIPGALEKPLRWRKPRRVFVNSMSDLFHESLADEAIAAVFGVMAAAPRHTFQILTKRAERLTRWFMWLERSARLCNAGVGMTPAARCFVETQRHPGRTPDAGFLAGGRLVEAALRAPWPLPNVWLGTSVEDQATADERIPLLLQTPAAVRFVSYEPALGPVDFSRRFGRWECKREHDHVGAATCPGGLDWVIVGGESGPGARPFEVAWARSAVRQCKAAGVPVFVKQLGARPTVAAARQQHWDWGGDIGRVARFEPTDPLHPSSAPWRVLLKNRKGGDMAEWPSDLRVREFPRGATA